MNSSLRVWEEQTSQVLENRSLILKINRAEKKKTQVDVEGKRLRKEKLMERKHEMSYCVTRTTLHAWWKLKKLEEKSHYSAPLSHGLTLVLTSLLESGFINHRYRGAFQCIIWFSLTGGQLSQDVCPPVPISLTQRKLIHMSGIWSVCTLIPMLKPHVPPKQPLISKHETYLFYITTSEND